MIGKIRNTGNVGEPDTISIIILEDTGAIMKFGSKQGAAKRNQKYKNHEKEGCWKSGFGKNGLAHDCQKYSRCWRAINSRWSEAMKKGHIESAGSLSITP